MGMGPNYTTRGLQVLVHVFTYQGLSWGSFFGPTAKRKSLAPHAGSVAPNALRKIRERGSLAWLAVEKLYPNREKVKETSRG